MSKKFKLKSDLTYAYLPNCGKIGKKTILEGLQYERYLGSVLEEVQEVNTNNDILSLEVEAKQHLDEMKFSESNDILLDREPIYTIQPVLDNASMLSVDEYEKMVELLSAPEAGLNIKPKKTKSKK